MVWNNNGQVFRSSFLKQLTLCYVCLLYFGHIIIDMKLVHGCKSAGFGWPIGKRNRCLKRIDGRPYGQ